MTEYHRPPFTHQRSRSNMCIARSHALPHHVSGDRAWITYAPSPRERRSCRMSASYEKVHCVIVVFLWQLGYTCHFRIAHFANSIRADCSKLTVLHTHVRFNASSASPHVQDDCPALSYSVMRKASKKCPLEPTVPLLLDETLRECPDP